MPTLPLSNTLIIDVDAEFVSSKIDPVPVPEPHIDSLEYGVDVPIARESVCAVRYAVSAGTATQTAMAGCRAGDQYGVCRLRVGARPRARIALG